MRATTKKLLVVAGCLYAVTWVGTALIYPRDMQRRALEEYSQAKIAEEEWAKKRLMPPSRPELFPDGPRVDLRWCVPLIPAVTLVSSDYYIGPLCSHGAIRIVLFYGFGTIESVSFVTWIS
jgi:hypothetical protein